MKLNPINSISFKGSIIDSHAHIGNWQGKKYLIDSLDEFIKQPLNVNGEEDTIEKMIVSNLSCIDKNGSLDEYTGNLEMLRESAKNGKYAPLAVCQPNLTKGDTSSMKFLLEKGEGKFCGFKFHPKELARTIEGKIMNADDAAYDAYLDLAKEKKLPCLFHSEVNVDWSGVKPVIDSNKSPSDPRYIYNLAKRHPDVPVILGHTGAGGSPSHEVAIDVMMESIKKKDALLYADISWMDWADNSLPAEKKTDIISFLKKLKKEDALDRVMFGTDAPLGCYGENPVSNKSTKEAYEMTVSTVKNAIKDEFGDEADDIIQKVFHDNAENLFFKERGIEAASIEKEAVKNSTSFMGKLKGVSPKLAAGIGAGVVVIAAVCGKLLYDNSKSKNNERGTSYSNSNAQTQTQTAIPAQTANTGLITQAQPVQNASGQTQPASGFQTQSLNTAPASVEQPVQGILNQAQPVSLVTPQPV